MLAVHFADLHLGIETYGRPDPATGLSTRLLDALRSLEELVEYAIREEADLVLFCGDAYKTRNPSQTQQRAFAGRIRRLLDEGIAVVMVAGNHDLPSTDSRASTLDIFNVLEPADPPFACPEVLAFRQPITVTIPTRAGPVQIVALPWPMPDAFLSREEQAGLTIDELLGKTADEVSAFIRREAEALDPTIPSILAAHVSLTRWPTPVVEGSERAMAIGKEVQLSEVDLHPDSFDYVALGHVHHGQVLASAPPIVYPGSLQRCDFGEEGAAKGFYTFNLDPTMPRGSRLVDAWPAFHRVWTRAFVTVEASPIAENPTAEVVAAIERAGVAEAIVRVVLRLSSAQAALLREADLREALAPAHFVAYIKREITDNERTARLPDALRPETLAPLDALRLYLDDRQVPPERQEVLVQHARALVEGEVGT